MLKVDLLLWYQENEVVKSVIRHKSGAKRAEGNLIGSYRLTAEKFTRLLIKYCGLSDGVNNNER